MSIRARVLWLVFWSVLLPALLVGWRYYEDRGKDVEIAMGGLTATARTIAANLDSKIQSTIQLHSGLARAHDLNSGNKALCSDFLSEVLEKNPQFTGILTIDPDGGLFCDSLRSGRVLDLRDRQYFKQAFGTVGSAVIEPVFGRLTGMAVLQIAYPARDQSERLQFVLLASLDLNKLLTEQFENLPRGYEILFVDNKGTVLNWVPVQRTSRQGTSIADTDLFGFVRETTGDTKELLNGDGEAQVWAVANTNPIGGVSLHVAVGRSKADLVASANRRLGEDMALLALVSVLLFVGAWLVIEFGIRLQISRISTMAKRLGSGDLAARIVPPYPTGELGTLMSVLNGTAASLERQRSDIEDLNQKLEQSQRLEVLEKDRLNMAISNMNQGLLLYDASERLVVCNKQYLEMFGVSPDVVKPGCSFRDIMMHRKEIGSFLGDVEEFCESVTREVAAGKATHRDMKTVDGRLVQVFNQPLATGGWMVTIEDITERKRFDERISHMAHYDALTDLPNRVLFGDQLRQALDGVTLGERLAVLYIDVDEFKRINDSLGHAVGDELLKTVGVRLRACIGPNDFVARLGGDEFAIIQTKVRNRTDTVDLVTRIYQAIREPIECEGHSLTTDASMGIAQAPSDGTDLDQLLKNADMAMYSAKADGRRTYRFFEPGMDARMKALRTLELDLRRAITEDGFELHYQPLVNLSNNTVSGCEALLRWKHPDRGWISPVEFIPVAEDTGLINQLGEWVLTAACKEAASWPDAIKIAVNVSPVQFRHQTFALNVANALVVSGLSSERLELEITEAVLIRDDEAALVTLQQLRTLGVRIALDDFGTGYSSLSYLQRFPFDKIKIDRSFIKDVAEPDGSASIVEAVVNIAAARHMITTAEGVETPQQLDALRKLGCTEMQGYLFSRPQTATDIRRLLQAAESRAA